MRRESAKYLFDVQMAAEALLRFVSGSTLSDYQQSELMRAGVNWEFAVIGEAISQLAKTDPETAERISDFRRIISFRNVLIHGYGEVNDDAVWLRIEEHLPTLVREVEELLAEA